MRIIEASDETWWQPGERRGEMQSLPDRFVVEVDEGPWIVTAEIAANESTQAHRVVAVTVRERSDDPRPIMPAFNDRRLRLPTLLREAVRSAIETWKITETNDDGTIAKMTKLHFKGDPQVRRGDHRYEPIVPDDISVSQAIAGTRRNAVTPAMRADALAAYEAAHNDPAIANAFEHIAHEFGKSVPTMKRWVATARDEAQS